MSEENNYLDSIPEEYREVPSIKEAGSMENLLKQHVNLEQKMGTGVFAPGQGADDEQWNKFYNKVNDIAPGLTRIPVSEDDEGWNAVYNKLGRPEDATGYETPQINISDNEALDQSDYEEAFKEVSHSLGLSGKQYAGIMKWIGDRTVEKMSAGAQARDEAVNALKSEWGDATDARIERVKELIGKFGGEGVGQALGELGNNPQVLMMLDKMADSIMEEKSLENYGGGGADQRSDIEAEIATLRQNDAFLNNKNPDHDRVVKRVNALYEKLETYKAA